MRCVRMNVQTALIGMLALCVTVAGVPAARLLAKGPQTQVKDAEFIIGSLGKTLAAARRLTEKTKFGYDGSDTCIGVAGIRPGSSYRFSRRLEKGKEYMFVGCGDRDAMDIDIKITSADGRVMAQDVQPDATPLVKFTPPRQAVYTIHVELSRARNSSYCSFAVLRDGGFDVPVVNAVTVARRFLDMCNATARVASQNGLSAELFTRPNQGAIWGTLLRGGESLTLSNLNIGQANCVVVASGDKLVRDIDLYLRDRTGSVVGKHVKPDANPVIQYHTAGESYSVKLENAAKNSPATLCLVGVLNLK